MLQLINTDTNEWCRRTGNQQIGKNSVSASSGKHVKSIVIEGYQ